MALGTVTGKELFPRSWAVTIGTASTASDTGTNFKAILLTENDIKFHAVKTIKSEPNKCKLSIYNLSEEHRAAIQELQPVTPATSVRDKKQAKILARKQAKVGIPVKIEAGYGGNNSLIWLGDMRTAKSTFQKPDWITEVESGDGEKAWANARVNVSYGPSTPKSTVFRAIVRALGIGEGNLAAIEKKLSAVIPQGTVVSGPAAQQLWDWCRSADLEWSIQDGAVQFTDRGAALAERAVSIREGAGMIESPTVDVDGIMSTKILMVPDIRPGRLCVVDSVQLKGNFRMERCTWEADSSGNDWSIKIEARRY